jgi:flagellar export protein FliJ
MKRFRYPLQALLTLRQGSEQQALEKYAGALLVRQRALGRLEAICQEQQEAWQRWRAVLGTGCPAGLLAQSRAYDALLRERQEQAGAALRQAELATHQALEELLNARRQRQAVDKHLQRQRDRHHLEMGRAEQKALDDLAGRRLVPVLRLFRAQHAPA